MQEPLYVPVAEEPRYQQPLYTQPQQPVQSQQPVQPVQTQQTVQQPQQMQPQQPQQAPRPTYATHNYPQPQTQAQAQAAAEEKPAAAPEKKKGFSLWNNVRERLVNLMTEPVEDDDIDNDN